MWEAAHHVIVVVHWREVGLDYRLSCAVVVFLSSRFSASSGIHSMCIQAIDHFPSTHAHHRRSHALQLTVPLFKVLTVRSWMTCVEVPLHVTFVDRHKFTAITDVGVLWRIGFLSLTTGRRWVTGQLNLRLDCVAIHVGHVVLLLDVLLVSGQVRSESGRHHRRSDDARVLRHGRRIESLVQHMRQRRFVETTSFRVSPPVLVRTRSLLWTFVFAALIDVPSNIALVVTYEPITVRTDWTETVVAVGECAGLDGVLRSRSDWVGAHCHLIQVVPADDLATFLVPTDMTSQTSS